MRKLNSWFNSLIQNFVLDFTKMYNYFVCKDFLKLRKQKNTIKNIKTKINKIKKYLVYFGNL